MYKKQFFRIFIFLFLSTAFFQYTFAQLNFKTIKTSEIKDGEYSFTLEGVSQYANSFIAIFRDSIMEPNTVTKSQIKISDMPDAELDLIMSLEACENIKSFDVTKNHRKRTGMIYSGDAISSSLKEK